MDGPEREGPSRRETAREEEKARPVVPRGERRCLAAQAQPRRRWRGFGSRTSERSCSRTEAVLAVAPPGTVRRRGSTAAPTHQALARSPFAGGVAAVGTP